MKKILTTSMVLALTTTSSIFAAVDEPVDPTLNFDLSATFVSNGPPSSGSCIITKVSDGHFGQIAADTLNTTDVSFTYECDGDQRFTVMFSNERGCIPSTTSGRCQVATLVSQSSNINFPVEADVLSAKSVYSGFGEIDLSLFAVVDPNFFGATVGQVDQLVGSVNVELVYE